MRKGSCPELEALQSPGQARISYSLWISRMDSESSAAIIRSPLAISYAELKWTLAVIKETKQVNYERWGRIEDRAVKQQEVERRR